MLYFKLFIAKEMAKMLTRGNQRQQIFCDEKDFLKTGLRFIFEKLILSLFSQGHF